MVYLQKWNENIEKRIVIYEKLYLWRWFQLRKVFRKNGISDIVGILDRDQKKWNGEKMGIPIVPVETIEEEKFDTIIVAVANYTSIADLLIAMGVEIKKYLYMT